MTGRTVKPRLGLDPCRPSCPQGDCANCVRFDLSGLPDDAEQRPRTVVIDASALRREGKGCGMYLRRSGSQARAHLPPPDATRQTEAAR